MLKTGLKTVGLDHVVLHVNDLAKSKKFYTGLLGMTVAHESSWQAFLKCGKQMVALFQVRDREPVKGGSDLNHVALQLASGTYEETKAQLEAWGLEVRGRPGDDHCIYFSDPDGHRLQLLVPGEH